MRSIKIKTIVLSGILAALVFVVTSFTVVRVPFVYIREAYFHAGDSMIYLSALVLGGPVAALISGFGSFLANLTQAAIGVVIFLPLSKAAEQLKNRL